MDKYIYRLKIELDGVSPLIWRRVLVNSDMDLSDFQLVIESVMEWDGSRPHQFDYNGFYFSDPVYGFKDVADSSRITLGELLLDPQDDIYYTYDFDDDWRHTITLEEILADDDDEILPTCLEADNAPPPDGCGGPWAYMELLKALKKPSHVRYNEAIEKLGKDFDATAFDIDEINDALERLTEDEDDDEDGQNELDPNSYFNLEPSEQLEYKRNFYDFLEMFHPNLNHLTETQLHDLVEHGASYLHSAMTLSREMTNYSTAMKMRDDGFDPELIYKYTEITL